MAAAEARAAWQRAANRYFVQEDAKRAPKFACCQSSTSSSKQVDNGPANAADGLDRPAVGFMSSNRRPAYSNVPPDAKWWLQSQPNYGHQRGVNFEQSQAKAVDLENCPPPATPKSDSRVGEICTMSEGSILSDDYEDLGSYFDVKKQPDSKLEEVDMVDNKVGQDFIDLKNMTDYYELMEMEIVGGSVSKATSKIPSNADSLWIGEEKVPWWRVTDGEELASFVAQKSLHHVENCDLPPPQKMHVVKEPFRQAKSVDYDEIFLSSTDWEAQSDAISSPSSGVAHTKHCSSMREGRIQNENTATSEALRTNNNNTPEKGNFSVSDPCKAKLLEALCHSQTRAREAEKAAKQAYTEKEHLLKLFFKQASQLFAYKQWLKLLQLENLLLQDNGNSSPLIVFPDVLPWVPHKPRKLRNPSHKPAKGKQRRRSPQGTDIGKYAVAFAVGFTLVGAGLILGWTVGWLLPSF